MNIARPNIGAARSPLSERTPEKIRDLPRQFLLEQLELYYHVRPPEQAVETDYSLWECAETGLQFAWPMKGGNLCFYEWVSQFASYYPGVRWEYGEVRRLIESDHPHGKISGLLDVGCGKGDFLRSLDFLPHGNRFALDFNEPAIAECRRQGFQAFCGTVEEALDAGFFPPEKFPVVTSFHCLEHVENTVDFVRSLLGAVAAGGRLFVSTPYSPMSFESEWFDVLNHPPHHMTRWNLDAYRRLAEIVGAKLRYFVPPSLDWRRTLDAFRLRHYGPGRAVGKARLLADLLPRFPEVVREFRKQRARRPIAADVILIELTVA